MSTQWGETAVQEVLSWGKRRRWWAQIRAEAALDCMPLFGLKTRTVRTVLLAVACGRGPEIGIPREAGGPFNNAAHQLKRCWGVSTTELETLYREGAGLAYDNTTPEWFTPRMRLCVAVRSMAEHPMLADDRVAELDLPADEMRVAHRIAGFVQLGMFPRTEDDPRVLVAAALELLELSAEEEEVLAVLQAEADPDRPRWAGLLADLRAARELLH